MSGINNLGDVFDIGSVSISGKLFAGISRCIF
jgi:hypothetical protein